MFFLKPFFGPLLFDNTDSDCRDHCANERSMASFLISSFPFTLFYYIPFSILPFLFSPILTFSAFLSYLRLSIYMSIVSIAIVISFHLKNQPSTLELRMALPLGIVFWTLGVTCLAVGFGNYVKTVTKYSRRMALVQTGWKTQAVRIISRLGFPH